MKQEYYLPNQIWKLEAWIKKNGRHFKRAVFERFKDDDYAVNSYTTLDEPAPTDWGRKLQEYMILSSQGKAARIELREFERGVIAIVSEGDYFQEIDDHYAIEGKGNEDILSESGLRKEVHMERNIKCDSARLQKVARLIKAKGGQYYGREDDYTDDESHSSEYLDKPLPEELGTEKEQVYLEPSEYVNEGIRGIRLFQHENGIRATITEKRGIRHYVVGVDSYVILGETIESVLKQVSGIE